MSKTNNKLISIVLPTYNGQEFIEESILSIINQTYKNWELIIVNDASTDKTINIIQKFSQQDARIKIINNKTNQHLPASLNIGFAHAKGDYLSWTSDDNYYQHNAIEHLIEFLENDQECLMVCSDFTLLSQNKQQIKVVDSSLETLLSHNPIGACFVYRREVLNLVGLYDIQKTLVEDYDFWLRVALQGKIKTIHKNLYYYRVHKNSLTAKHQAEIQIATNKLLAEYWPLFLKKFPNLENTKSYKRFQLIQLALQLQFQDSKELILKLKTMETSNILYKIYKNAFLVYRHPVYLKAIRRLGPLYRIKSFLLKKKHTLSLKAILNLVKQELSCLADNAKILIVIPSDSLQSYEQKGLDWMERYYNPQCFFDKVFCLSPLEWDYSHKYGMTVIGVTPKTYKKLTALIKPNAVRAYGGYWATTFAIKNSQDDTPIICSIHDTNHKLLHKEIKFANAIICMSMAVADTVIQKYGKNLQNKIKILPNRIDTTIFFPKTSPFMPPNNIIKRKNNRKYILFIGRLTEQKNLTTLIKALKYLAKDYYCICIGRGDKEPYVNLAKAINVNSRIIWIDSVKNSHLPYYYSFVDCMCTPSLWEGFGMVFIEAAACGSAIITSNIAPMNEYLTHNHSAYLVDDYKSPQVLAQAIDFVCSSPHYKKTLQNGALEVGKKFSNITIDAQEVSIYKQIINSNQRRSL